MADIEWNIFQYPQNFPSDAHKVDYVKKSRTEIKKFSQTQIQKSTVRGYTYIKFATTLNDSEKYCPKFISPQIL